MRSRAPSRAQQIAVVSLVGMLMGTIAIFSFLASRKSPCCGDLVPYASIYHEPLSQLDVALLGGDGHAFAAIAQDPLLSRPSVLREPAEFTYRAQRPVWGYLTWIASAGQSRLTGWVLVVLAILACGAACATAGILLVQRGGSPWWGLVVPIAGYETLTEMTPELFALSLIGAGVLLWRQDRRVLAVLVLSLAALTRETALVAIAGLACWELFHQTGVFSLRVGLRRVAILGVPLGVYLAWICFLRLRLGNWPFFHSNERLSLPGIGLAKGLSTTEYPSAILLWVVIALGLCAAAVRWARHDVLTWITIAYFAFASILGLDVWVTNMGFQRALLPLYVFGAIAVVGTLDVRTATEPDAREARPTSESSDAEDRRQEPAGVTVRRLRHELG